MQIPWQILIVEDNADSRHVIDEAVRLYRKDAEIQCAANGRKALEILQSYSPSLVIVDLALPDLDGWSVLEAMQANEATAHIPVVAVTAYHSVSVGEDALRAGFSAYFPKPIDVLSFGESLSKLIQT
jgi:CheY-like chemotaxis protein